SVFQQPPSPSAPPTSVAPGAASASNSAELEYLREENRRLTEDFQEALSVIRRISDARKADQAQQKPVELLLAELKKAKEENLRLRLKINAILSQVSTAAYMDDDDDDD